MTDSIRMSPGIELRADPSGDGHTLAGYAAVFNSPTEIKSWEGHFIETLAPGAFKQAPSRTAASRIKRPVQPRHGPQRSVTSRWASPTVMRGATPQGLWTSRRPVVRHLLQQRPEAPSCNDRCHRRHGPFRISVRQATPGSTRRAARRPAPSAPLHRGHRSCSSSVPSPSPPTPRHDRGPPVRVRRVRDLAARFPTRSAKPCPQHPRALRSSEAGLAASEEQPHSEPTSRPTVTRAPHPTPACVRAS
jgi:hypothetical protein